MSIEIRNSVAEEWFADFLRRASIGRRRERVLGEGVVLPPGVAKARQYQDETDRKLVFIRGREQQLELKERMRARAKQGRPVQVVPEDTNERKAS